jgi:hypothetical protein
MQAAEKILHSAFLIHHLNTGEKNYVYSNLPRM